MTEIDILFALILFILIIITINYIFINKSKKKNNNIEKFNFNKLHSHTITHVHPYTDPNHEHDWEVRKNTNTCKPHDKLCLMGEDRVAYYAPTGKSCNYVYDYFNSINPNDFKYGFFELPVRNKRYCGLCTKEPNVYLSNLKANSAKLIKSYNCIPNIRKRCVTSNVSNKMCKESKNVLLSNNAPKNQKDYLPLYKNCLSSCYNDNKCIGFTLGKKNNKLYCSKCYGNDKNFSVNNTDFDSTFVMTDCTKKDEEKCPMNTQKDGDNCVLCPSGYYNYLEGTMCKKCPKNTKSVYKNENNKFEIACQDCNKYEFSREGSDKCNKCASNRQYADREKLMCSELPSIRHVSCKETDSLIKKGMCMTKGNSKNYYKCSENEIADEKTNTCINGAEYCATFKKRHRPNNNTCIDCDDRSVFSDNENKCVKCEPNEIKDNNKCIDGVSKCSQNGKLPITHISNTNDCQNCSNNKYLNYTKKICEYCPDNYQYKKDTNHCTVCNVNEISNDNTSNTCQNCPNFKYPILDKSTGKFKCMDKTELVNILRKDSIDCENTDNLVYDPFKREVGCIELNNKMRMPDEYQEVNLDLSDLLKNVDLSNPSTPTTSTPTTSTPTTSTPTTSTPTTSTPTTSTPTTSTPTTSTPTTSDDNFNSETNQVLPNLDFLSGSGFF